MIKTTGKEYFYMVSGLMPPKYMIDEQLTENIEFFVDWVSKNTSRLDFLINRNAVKFTLMMEELYVLLCSINAHWLEMEAARILRLIDIEEKELCGKLIIQFVANLRTLAIDIQMAQNQGFETSYRQRDEIERYRGVINSVKVVATLMKSREYEKSLDMALNINELQGSVYQVQLMSAITSHNDKLTMTLIEKIIELFTDKIDTAVALATKTIVLKKILIVDDMPEILTALSHMLKDHYQVFAFSNCNEALSFIDAKEKPDAFLLDIDMPDMDGFTLAKKIREFPQYAHTPLLFLTGNSTNETLVKSLMCGAKAFIVKPASKDIIISKLSSCLD